MRIRTVAKRAALLGMLLGLALASVPCAGCLKQAPPAESPGITGVVTSLVAGDGRPASVLVETSGTPLPGSISDKAQVNIPPATRFFAADGSAASLDAIQAIKVGTKMRVWFEGAVAESYPVQGSAKAIQLLR